MFNLKTLNVNLIINFISNISQAIVSILLTPILLKYFGIEAFGLISLLAYIQTFFFLLDAGFSNTLTIEISKYRGSNDIYNINRISSLFLTIFIFGALSILIGMFIFSPIVHNLVKDAKNITPSSITKSALISGVILSLRFFGIFQRAVLLGYENHFKLSKTLIILNFFKLFSFFFIIKYKLLTTDVNNYFTMMLLIQILEFLYLNILFKKTHNLSLSFKFKITKEDYNENKNVFKMCFNFLIIGLCTILISYSDKFFLAKNIPLNEFGIYSISMTICSFFLFLSSPFITIATPLFSNTLARGENDLIINQFEYLSILNLTILISAYFIFNFNSTFLLSLWLKNNEIIPNVTFIVKYWSLGTILTSFLGIQSNILTIKGKLYIINKYNSILAVLIFILFFIFIKVFGINGSISVWLFYALVSFVFFQFLMINEFTFIKYIKIVKKWSYIIAILFLPYIIIFYSNHYLKFNNLFIFLIEIIINASTVYYLFTKKWKKII